MSKVVPDPEFGSQKYFSEDPKKFGSTDITSGSAVIPSYQSRIVDYLPYIKNFLSDDAEDTGNYKKEFRKIIIEQLKKDVLINEQIYKTQMVLGEGKKEKRHIRNMLISSNG